MIVIYPKKPKFPSEGICTPLVHWSVLYNDQDVEAAHVSVTTREGKRVVGLLHVGYYTTARKTEKKSYLCAKQDGPGEHYAKVK